MQIVLTSVLLTFCSAITRTDAVQCYICGKGAEQPFKNSEIANGNFNGNHLQNNHEREVIATQLSPTGATIPNLMNTISKTCNGFDIKSDSRVEFVMECPTRYSGCITEIEGTRTTRTCEKLNVNDCKIANNITYCYCNTDLCNGEQMSILTSRAWRHKDLIENYDDEDFSESSGMDENGYHKRKNRINTAIDGSHKNIGSAITINQKLLKLLKCTIFIRLILTFRTFYET